jgi:cytochrome c-type biogenesis protein
VVEIPSLLLAFLAGFVSFVSPCCLPLVPGYLAVVGGDAEQSGRRLDPKVLGRSLVFVSTFSALFILLGLTATALGAFLFRNQPTLNKVAGVAIIALGLFFVLSIFIVSLNRDWHPRGLVERAGRGGPVVAGAAFALAWTPCVGPTLGAILGLAATSRGTGGGALLLAVYAAGLAVPFLLSAVAFGAATRAFSWFRRHYAAVQVVSGVILVGMGALVFSGELFRLNVQAQRALNDLGLNLWQSL